MKMSRFKTLSHLDEEEQFLCQDVLLQVFDFLSWPNLESAKLVCKEWTTVLNRGDYRIKRLLQVKNDIIIDYLVNERSITALLDTFVFNMLKQDNPLDFIRKIFFSPHLYQENSIMGYGCVYDKCKVTKENCDKFISLYKKTRQHYAKLLSYPKRFDKNRVIIQGKEYKEYIRGMDGFTDVRKGVKH